MSDSITSQADLAGLYTVSGIFGLIWYILVVVALWKVFAKAGWPGILAIIPIVNMFILVKIAGWSAWLGLLFFIPIANIVLHIMVAFRVGKAFGKGGVFSFFLLFLIQWIGYFIIGFGKAQYTKPV
ncbi:DUF5684 domain-containing protein [Microbacterium aoyamense]|uniref:DUF5684 domain-containing protein n=1 Tax=Microbacterium aoyamense TaxID=344166 RepID=A0ABN2PET6_9MICO|nr:DUF5684 domain-containing protein [Microbacterium aoyamense]